jgi:hypothetical protein
MMLATVVAFAVSVLAADDDDDDDDDVMMIGVQQRSEWWSLTGTAPTGWYSRINGEW